MLIINGNQVFKKTKKLFLPIINFYMVEFIFFLSALARTPSISLPSETLRLTTRNEKRREEKRRRETLGPKQTFCVPGQDAGFDWLVI